MIVALGSVSWFGVLENITLETVIAYDSSLQNTLQIEFFHSKSIRIILWATSMIDTDSSNYNDAYDNEYLIK